MELRTRKPGYIFYSILLKLFLGSVLFVSLVYGYAYPPPAYSYVDFHANNFSNGVMINVTTYGSGATINLTLKRNISNGYPNATGNFTSQVFDSGRLSNWTYISWSQELPYQKEIGRANGDQNNSQYPYINTSGLVGLWYFNNESAFGEATREAGNANKTVDYSVYVNRERAGSNASNGSFFNGATINKTNFKTGNGSAHFDGVDDYVNVGSGPNLDLEGALTVCAWIYAKALPEDKSFVSNGNTDFTNIQYALEVLSDGRPALHWSDNVPNFGFAIGTAGDVVIGSWYHICGRRSSTGTGSIFVNGVNKTASNAEVTPPTSPGGTTAIGRVGAADAEFWNGLIDEVAIWNRSLSVAEIRNIYTRGVLRLNISTRTSQDNITWTSWSAPYQNESNSTIVGTTEARYLQYKAALSTESGNFTPILNNVTINYAQSIAIDSFATLPTYPRKDQNITLITALSATTGVNSVNFTLIDPSGAKVVNNRNGSNVGSNWNFSSWNLTSFGTWLWNVTVFDSNGGIINSTTQQIILMEINMSLNRTSASASNPISIYGHINLSNNTNVSNTRYYVWLDDLKLNDSGNYTDSSDTDFNFGSYINLTTYGSGANANLTLKRNISNGYPNATGNFTRVIDAGGIVNWSSLSWNQEVPYQKEIGRANRDGNKSSYPFINTSGLVGLWYFNNESAFGEATREAGNANKTVDYSVYVNQERAGSNANNGTFLGGATINKTVYKMGNGSGSFDGTNDFVNVGSGQSLGITGPMTICAWVKADTFGPGENMIMGRSLASGEGPYALFVYTENELHFSWLDNVAGFEDYYADGVPISTGVWAHVCGVRVSDSSVLLYVDGTSRAVTVTGSASITNPVASTSIGKLGDYTSGLFWDGLIDEVGIWNRTLSGSEVRALYKRGALRLNISTRTSNDNLIYSQWSPVYQNETYSSIAQNSTARYLQYRVSMSTESGNYTPILNDITINYSGLFTDNFGNYNYTFIAPASAATYSVKVNTTYLNLIPGEQLTTFQVTAGSQSVIHLDGGLFEIRDSSDNRIATFDAIGNVNIKGTLSENAEPSADHNDFTIQNGSGGLNMVITNPEGNLLVKKSLSQGQNGLSAPLNSFVVENRSKQVVAYINSTGGMFITGTLYESRTFD